MRARAPRIIVMTWTVDAAMSIRIVAASVSIAL